MLQLQICASQGSFAFGFLLKFPMQIWQVFVTFNLGEDPGNIFVVVYFMGKSLLRQASSNSTTSPWPSFLNERLSAAAVRSYLPSLAEEKYTLGMAGEENRKGGRPKLWQTTMLRTFWKRTLLILQPLLTSQKKALTKSAANYWHKMFLENNE